MTDKAVWYRVFAKNAASVHPVTVLQELTLQGTQVQGHFQADEHGWYRCELAWDLELEPIVVECFRASEEGVRPELLSWAAYLETLDSPIGREFMALVHATAQVFTMQLPDARAAELLKQLCGNLARAADGVYQVDGEGFFWSNGALALGEVA